MTTLDAEMEMETSLTFPDKCEFKKPGLRALDDKIREQRRQGVTPERCMNMLSELPPREKKVIYDWVGIEPGTVTPILERRMEQLVAYMGSQGKTSALEIVAKTEQCGSAKGLIIPKKLLPGIR